MNQLIRNIQRALAVGALTVTGASAFASANPNIPNYGWGAITATPSSPIVGESAHITVQVNNSGDTDVAGVQVKVSFNDWGVTFNGWQEIHTWTTSIPAGQTVTLDTDHTFVSRTHTCLEALIISPVGTDENTNPNDDRGQINLEVVNAGGDVFTYDVPVVNNGPGALDLAVQGHCVKQNPDGTVPGNPKDDRCKGHADAMIHLEPGEEAVVPVQIDLAGMADGEMVEFMVEAFDLANLNNKNNVVLRIFKRTAQGLKKQALNDLNALIAGQQGALKNQLSEVAKKLQKELDAARWVGPNALVKNGGAEVFALDADVVRKLLQLMNDVARITKPGMDNIVRSLVDSDRIIADQANHAAGGVARAEMRDGDADREAGEYPDAIGGYKHAFQVAGH
jgi:hypothetical protein